MLAFNKPRIVSASGWVAYVAVHNCLSVRKAPQVQNRLHTTLEAAQNPLYREVARSNVGLSDPRSVHEVRLHAGLCMQLLVGGQSTSGRCRFQRLDVLRGAAHDPGIPLLSIAHERLADAHQLIILFKAPLIAARRQRLRKCSMCASRLLPSRTKCHLVVRGSTKHRNSASPPCGTAPTPTPSCGPAFRRVLF